MSPIILYLFFLFVVHSIPVIIVHPFKRCKIVLEFVPASYAINRLCKCPCGNSMLPINKLMFPDTRSKFLESSSHRTSSLMRDGIKCASTLGGLCPFSERMTFSSSVLSR